MTAFTEWMSVALIAVSRCLYLTKPNVFEKLFGRKRAWLVVLLVWIYANLLIAPIYSGVNKIMSCIFLQIKRECLQWLGHFGYVADLRRCDIIADNVINNTETFTVAIAYSLSLFLTTGSCFIIWWYVISSGKYLKKSGYVTL